MTKIKHCSAILQNRKRIKHKEYKKGKSTRANQSEKDGTNINNLLKQYTVSEFNKINQDLHFGDFKKFNYQDAVDNMHAIHDLVDQIPPEIRLKFDNDPHKIIKFANNASEKELVAIGLLDEKDIKTKNAQSLESSNSPKENLESDKRPKGSASVEEQ